MGSGREDRYAVRSGRPPGMDDAAWRLFFRVEDVDEFEEARAVWKSSEQVRLVDA